MIGLLVEYWVGLDWIGVVVCIVVCCLDGVCGLLRFVVVLSLRLLAAARRPRAPPPTHPQAQPTALKTQSSLGRDGAEAVDRPRLVAVAHLVHVRGHLDLVEGLFGLLVVVGCGWFIRVVVLCWLCIDGGGGVSCWFWF